MNDQQLEAVLRRSLAGHADTVDSGPTWPLTEDILAEHRDRRRRPASWWAVAATVAAVLTVIGVVLAVRHATAKHSRPATPVTITRTACMTSLPKAWQDAVGGGALPKAVNGPLLGIGPDGAVVTGLDKRIVLVQPDGSSQTLLDASWMDVVPAGGIPDNDIFKGQTVAIDQHWIVVPVMKLSSVRPDFDYKLVLIDRADPHNKREIHVPSGPNKFVVFADHMYVLYGGKGDGSVQDYDIATGKTREITKQASYLAATPHGVSWTDPHNGSHVIAGHDATLVPGHSGSEPQLVSDGPNYAWWTTTGIGWYSEATKQTVYVHDSAAFDAGYAVGAVVGPYVFTFVNEDGAMRVIDTRTGAQGRIPEVGSVNSGGGAITYTGNGGTIRVDTKGLPGLHC
jgi:hypothetical protein